MEEEEDRLKQLQTEWNDNIDPVIEGNNGSYKLLKNKFLGRGGFGIVFLALRQYRNKDQRVKHDRVVVKEFKKSQKWQNKNDWDRQLLILSQHYEEWDPTYILQVIDIFQAKKTSRHYLVTKYAPEGNLAERMKTNIKEEEIHKFSLRSAQILYYLHHEALKNYKSCSKGEESNLIGVIHRDFKPANLVFVKKNDFEQMFLIDFGISKIGYTQIPKKYTNCGTNNYKAPEISQRQPYNAKVDIYSFGCTLFQMLSGQRLLGAVGIETHHQQRQKFVRNRLQNLQYKFSLMGQQKIKNSFGWLEILSNCLEYNHQKRWSSRELLEYLNSSSQDTRTTKPFFKEFTVADKTFFSKKQLYQLNFQIYRANIIQDLIFQIFEYLYFSQPRINKFSVYGIVKYAIFFIVDKYNKIKEKARLLKNLEKVSHIKRLIDERKIQEIKKKAHQKLVDEYYKEKDIKGTRNQEVGPVQEMIMKYPELLKESAPESRRIFFEFCYQKRKEIMELDKFAEIVAMIIVFMDDFQSYHEIQLTETEIEGNVEGESIKKLASLRLKLQKKIKSQTIQHILDECQVQMSVRSGMNKQQVKTDLRIQKRQ